MSIQNASLQTLSTNGSHKRLKVLIADDVAEMRRGTRLMMAEVPEVEVVAIAHDGREAVEMAIHHEVDIAVMDINMPRMDGLAAIRRLSREAPNVACIVISAERDSETLKEAMMVGARGFIIKPFTVDQLQTVMQRVIRMIRETQAHRHKTDELRHQRNVYLAELAREYRKARRTDDKALHVFEKLAANPDCEMQWLVTLAMIYVVRQQWGKLKALSARLETLETV